MNMDAIIEIYFFQFQINKFIQMLLSQRSDYSSEWLWMYKLIITKFNQSNPIR